MMLRGFELYVMETRVGVKDAKAVVTVARLDPWLKATLYSTRFGINNNFLSNNARHIFLPFGSCSRTLDPVR